jgi:predicted O-methyltransferase YrrM
MISNMIQPKRVLEIGTFTGYATLCLAEGLPENGILYTLDINEELEPLFSKYFDAIGLSKKIKFIPGNAIKTIPEIDEIFDLVFIDADKHNYCKYFDLVIEKTRIGGFIIADNVLWSGKVVQEKKDKDTQAIHDYNIKIKNDSRVENVILPIRDGLNIARRIK